MKLPDFEKPIAWLLRRKWLVAKLAKPIPIEAMVTLRCGTRLIKLPPQKAVLVQDNNQLYARIGIDEETVLREILLSTIKEKTTC
jgi:hypothetical protein